MQWQTSLPLIAILRGITPDEALAHVGAAIAAGFDYRGDPAQFTAMAAEHPGRGRGLRRAGADWRRNGAAGSAGRSAGAAWGAAGGDPQCAAGGDPPGRRARNDRLRRLRDGKRGVYRAGGRGAGAEDFPSSAFGPDYIRALKAVLPASVPVFAVGGVTPENLAQWIEAGCAGAGLGSDLYRAGQPVTRTAEQAAAFVRAYQEAVK